MAETRYVSPDGRFLFRIDSWEGRMSHTIETPELVERATGKSLLQFRDSNWSLDEAYWLSETKVVIRLRKYPGAHQPPSFVVEIECASGTALMEEEVFPLQQLEERLERRV